MTSLQRSPPFDEPSLSDIYMSDGDDLSEGSVASSAAGSLFQIYHAMPQNDTLIAEMPAESLSKIHMTQSQSISNVQRNSLPQAPQQQNTRMRSPCSKHKQRQGNDPPGHDPTPNLNMTRFIYAVPELQEMPSSAPTLPTKKDCTSRSRLPKTGHPYLQQRRMHLCVIFLTFMFLLLGITVAVIGHSMYQGEEPTTATASSVFEKEGSLIQAVPIDLPNTISIRSPTLSPSSEMESLSTAPSVVSDTRSPIAMPSSGFGELATAIEPTFPPSPRPTLWPTRSPTHQPTETLTLQSPPTGEPTRAPRTPRPTSAPVRSPARPELSSAPTASPVKAAFTPDPTFVPGKKAKGEKRQ